MLKQLLILFFCVAMTLPSMCQRFVVKTPSGHNLTCIVDDDHATVSVKKNGNIDGELVIPNTVVYRGNEYVVAEIDERAFVSCTEMTSVSRPNSVTEIGDEAFLNCTRLKSINIPQSVRDIEGRAFKGCKSLTHINLSNTMVEELEEQVFEGCGLLEMVVLPSSITEIDKRAFAGCVRLKNIEARSVVAPRVEVGAFGAISDEMVLTVPKGSTASYRGRWIGFRNIVEK